MRVARTLAKVDFQFRDIREKAATDTGDLAHSQKLLAHKNRKMTEHYAKARISERVKPLGSGQPLAPSSKSNDKKFLVKRIENLSN